LIIKELVKSPPKKGAAEALQRYYINIIFSHTYIAVNYRYKKWLPGIPDSHYQLLVVNPTTTNYNPMQISGLF